MRTHRLILTSLLGASMLATPTAAALGAAPRAANKPSCQAVSSALLKRNATNERTAKRLMHNTNYTPIVRTYTPKPASAARFNGYETITVKSPKGTSPVVGYFQLSGARQCSVVVTSAKIALQQKAYVVKLKFPGEQGNPGHLTVGLVSR